MFISKTGNTYQWMDFSSTGILNKPDLLSNYSLKELDDIYKSHKLGDHEFLYKDILLAQIDLYDRSDNVNSFIYKGNKYWLDKQQRSCMKTVSESGLKEVEVVLGDDSIILPSEFVKQFILQLEAYAYKCYVVTAKHLATANKLETSEDIIKYDYTSGYPDKIVLE
jgi:hypothetical protein